MISVSRAGMWALNKTWNIAENPGRDGMRKKRRKTRQKYGHMTSIVHLVT